jgi:hypothetical protein
MDFGAAVNAAALLSAAKKLFVAHAFRPNLTSTNPTHGHR